MKKRAAALFMSGIMIFTVGCAQGKDQTATGSVEAVEATESAGAADENEGSLITAVNARQDGSTVDIDLSERAYNVDFPEYNTSYDYKEWDKNDVTYISFAGESAEVKGKDAGGVKAENGTVTITSKGTYVLSGNLDGKIVVDTAEEKCRLILNGVTIVSKDGPAVYGKSAKNLYISIEDGTENSISDAVEYTAGDDDGKSDAAIYSKCDLIFNGTGTLNITGNNSGAVHGKDDLIFRDGIYIVDAVDDAIKGKDTLQIYDGNYQIEAGEKGLSSTNDTDEGRGDLYIEGGSISITAGDDTVHSNRNVLIVGGDLSLSGGDDGIHADENVLIYGASVDIKESNEALEAKVIDLTGSDVKANSRDDGLNAAGADSSGAASDPMAGNADNIIYIDGGSVYVNAGGDGLDSNGYIYLYDGDVTVDGPENDGNGFFDYGIEFVMTGGNLIGAGSSGMLQAVSDSSPVKCVVVGTGYKEGGTEVTVKDKDGDTVAAFAPAKSYQAVVFAGSYLQDGKTYEAYVSDSDAALGEITINETVNIIGDVKMHGGPGGPGGFGGFGGPGGKHAPDGKDFKEGKPAPEAEPEN